MTALAVMRAGDALLGRPGRPPPPADRRAGRTNRGMPRRRSRPGRSSRPRPSRPAAARSSASSLRCSRSAAATCFCSLAASTPARSSISRSRSDASRPAMTSRMFVSWSLKSRFSLQKTQSVPSSVVGRGDRHAHGGREILGHVPRRHDAVVVEHDRVAQAGLRDRPWPLAAVWRERRADRRASPHEDRSFSSVVASSRR